MHTKVIVSSTLCKPLKFLVPLDILVAGLVLVVRKRVKLQPHQAIFLFQGPSLVNTGLYVAHLPRQDGIVHLTLSLENTFG